MNNEMKIDFESLLEAWYECRKSKRRTPAAMDFEIDAEHNLYTGVLYEYRPPFTGSQAGPFFAGQL